MEDTKPGFSDYLEFNKYRAINLMHIGRMAAKHGPFDLLRDMKRYPWLWDLLKVNSLLRRLVDGRSGNYRTAVAMVLGGVVDGVIELLEGIFYRSDRLILHEDLLPPEIFRAMGLQPWVPELLGILLPMIVPDSMQKYLDAAENEGIPPDICSLPRATIGVAIKNALPPPLAVVSSNMPCDGGMSSYTVIAKQVNKPAYWVDVPFDFKNERALDYFAGELKAMIAWLEEHTPGRMDWDRLKEICKKRNAMAELELDIWDMIRHRPAPMAAEAVWMSHIWFFNINPGYDTSIKLLADLKSLTEKNLAAGVSAVPREKYRALLWNPPTLHYVDLMVWAEKDLRRQSHPRQHVLQPSTLHRHLIARFHAEESRQHHHAGTHGQAHPRSCGDELFSRYLPHGQALRSRHGLGGGTHRLQEHPGDERRPAGKVPGRRCAASCDRLRSHGFADYTQGGHSGTGEQFHGEHYEGTAP